MNENARPAPKRELDEQLLQRLSRLPSGAAPEPGDGIEAGLLRELDDRSRPLHGPGRFWRRVLDSRWTWVLVLLLLALLGWDLARIIGFIFK